MKKMYIPLSTEQKHFLGMIVNLNFDERSSYDNRRSDFTERILADGCYDISSDALSLNAVAKEYKQWLQNI